MRLLLLFSLAAGVWAQPAYDVLLKGGHLIDPKNKVSALRDVAIKDGKVAAIAPSISPSEARKTIVVSGLYVVPGLVDIHAHVFSGTGGQGLAGGDSSIHPDSISQKLGITTVVDAGSSGRHNFAEFRRTIIDRARTRVLVFLNIGGQGMPGDEREQNVDDMDAKAAAALAMKHKDVVVGIKVAHYTGPDWTPVERGVEAGTLANIPVMIDFGAFRLERPFQDLVLKKLRPGDIYTHAYYAPVPYFDKQGMLLPYLREARKRGVLFDVGHGGAAFEFKQAARAVKQGFPPDTISTDVHSGSLNAGMKDMLNVMAKFLNMGLGLEDVIYRSTWNAARAIRREELGHLSVGAAADIAVLRVEKGDYGFVDSWGAGMRGMMKLSNELTLRDGYVIYDTNGRTRENWDKLGDYQPQGEPWWDQTRSSGPLRRKK
ncbi:MAG TPA: amidohydrolase/deacetylase family metallohydrolase [Bryobacteraceae bacterium]|nr:amidohydrolase/deacetylase family metallohydrolase [Bryobacteraceae bacterium]